MDKKKPIAPKLNELKIGESENFPRIRVDSIRGAIQRIQEKTHKKFSCETIGDLMEVTRIM